MAILTKNWVRFVDIMTKRNTMSDHDIAMSIGLKDTGAVQSWISRLKSRARREGIDNLIDEWNKDPDQFKQIAGLITKQQSEPIIIKQKSKSVRSKQKTQVIVTLSDIILHVINFKKQQEQIIEDRDVNYVNAIDPSIDSFLLATIGKGKKRIRLAEDTIKFMNSYLNANRLKISKV